MKNVVGENGHSIKYVEHTNVHESEWHAIYRALCYLEKNESLTQFDAYYRICNYRIFNRVVIDIMEEGVTIIPSISFDVDGTVVAIANAGLGTEEVVMWLVDEDDVAERFMYNRTEIVRK